MRENRMEAIANRFAMVVLATIMVATLSGCEGKGSSSTESTSTMIQTESVKPESSGVDQASRTDTPEVLEPKKNLKKLKSDYGYTITYDKDIFHYRCVEGYDDFFVESDEASKPSVFVSISFVGKEFVKQVAVNELGKHPKSCSIGQAKTQAQCNVTEENWKGGKVIRKKYIYPFESGDALLIVTQWYSGQTDTSYEDMISGMLKSITDNEK